LKCFDAVESYRKRCNVSGRICLEKGPLWDVSERLSLVAHRTHARPGGER
jgi:hypothetical protein